MALAAAVALAAVVRATRRRRARAAASARAAQPAAGRGDDRATTPIGRRRPTLDGEPRAASSIPRLDLLAPVVGVIGAVRRGGVRRRRRTRSRLARLVVGALFLGAVTDAMLLGHWYLVQPGLGRDPIKELVKCGRRCCGRSSSSCS